MKKLIIISAIVLLALLLTIGSVTHIGEGEVGIAKPNFIFKEARTLDSGLHFLFPFAYSVNKYSLEPLDLELIDGIEFTSKLGWKRIVSVKLSYRIIEEKIENLKKTGGDIEEYLTETLNETAQKYFFKLDTTSFNNISEYQNDLKGLLASKAEKAGISILGLRILDISIDYGKQKLNEVAKIRRLWEEKKRKVILLGMDALDLTIMQKLLDAGELPNFAELIKNGTSGILKSMDPMLSPLIWTSIATGVYPDVHGILDFVQENKDGKLVPITSRMRKVPAMWNILSELDISVGFVAWWATWPAEKVNGFMVSERLEYQLFNLSIDTSELKKPEGKIYPSEDFETVTRIAAPEANVSYDTISRFVDISREEWEDVRKLKIEESATNKIVMLKQLITSTEAYHKIGLHMYEKYKPALFSPYFEGTDVIGHLFMEFRPPKRQNVSEKDYRAYSKAVPEYYRYIDNILGDYIKLLDDDTDLIVVSDHGFKSGPDRPYSSADIKADTAVDWHDMSGTILLYGDSFKKGYVLKDADVIDVFPTVFATMNLPASEKMPGKVLKDAFVVSRDEPERIPDYMSFVPIHGQMQGGETDIYDKEIIENLKALGYLDTGGNVDDKGKRLLSEINKSAVLLSQKKYNEAEKLLKDILKREPKMVDAWVQLARIYSETGKKEKELEASLKILENARSQSDVEIGVRGSSKILLKKGKIKRAIGLLEMATNDYPQSYDMLTSLARLYIMAGRNGDVITICNKILSMKPDDVLSYNMMADAYFVTGRNREAKNAWERAFQLKPDLKSRSRNYYINLGLMEARAKNIGSAVSSLRQATRIDPKSYLAWHQLGNILIQTRDFREAEKAMKKALETAATPAMKGTAYAGLVLIYNALGNGTLEKKHLDDGLKTDPNNLMLHRFKAFSHLKNRDPENAKLEFRKVIELNPKDWDSMNRLGALLIQEGKQDEALRLLRRSLSINGNQPRLKETLKRFGN